MTMTVKEEIKAIEARLRDLKDKQRNEAFDKAKVLLEDIKKDEMLLVCVVEIANQYLSELYRDEFDE